MAEAPDLATSLVWFAQGTQLFLDALGGLADEELAAPSVLPGWTRKHVMAHVHHNGLAVGRLATWAATGVEQPMYPHPERRRQDIEDAVGRPAEDLRTLLTASIGALAETFGSLTEAQWDREVQTLFGDWVPASTLPYMRAREISVHAVDLGGSVGFADLPAGFVERLLADTVESRIAQGHGPALAGWLTGRAPAAPQIGAWI